MNAFEEFLSFLGKVVTFILNITLDIICIALGSLVSQRFVVSGAKSTPPRARRRFASRGTSAA